MKKIEIIPVNTVYWLIDIVFRKLGVPKADAKICADVLIASDLRGIESHGIGRLKMYYDRIKEEIQFPVTKIDIIKDNLATAVWDGNHGMGQVIAHKAMETAIEKARVYGMGSVAVRNSNHYGIAGYYSKMAADNDMIGMSFTNARPAIAPTFGVEPMFGTNPITFAAPTDLDFHFLYDGATSICQRGKIEVLDREDKITPDSWVIDEKGNPLTDSKDILSKLITRKASLLPLGGSDELSGAHKGYGFATIVEILSSALQGGSFLHTLGGMKNGRSAHLNLGHFFMAINIDSFIEIKEFKRITGEIIRQLQNSEKKPGKERIYVAGEKEFLKEKEIRKSGIPINPALRNDLLTIIEELQIPGIQL